MAVPTPTFKDTDLTDGWTELGSPAFVPDQHSASNVALLADGVNDMLDQPEIITTGSVHSVFCWMKSTSTSGIIMAQFAANPVDFGTFTLELSGGKIASRWDGTSEANKALSIGATQIDDGLWHYVGAVVRSAADIDLYIDGVEDTYTTQNQLFGSGFTATVNSSIPLTLGNYWTSGTSDSFYGGEVSRPSIWSGTALTNAQILEDFNDECDSVIVPTTTATFNDLTTGFTESGSPTFTDDQHAIGVALDADNVDDVLERAEVITTGTVASVAGWFKTSSTVGGTLWAQARNSASPGADRGTFHVTIGSTGLLVSRFDAFSDTNLLLSDTSTAFNDGIWHNVMVVARDFDDLDIYVDGVEVSYGTQNQVIGTGFTGVTNSSVSLSIGSFETGGLGNFFDGVLSRLSLWENIDLSSCQIKKYYDNECASVFVPTVTNQYLDFTANTFTQHGILTPIPDQFHDDVTFDFDGIDDYLSSTETPIGASSGAEHSFSFWYKDAGQSANRTVAAQSQTSPNTDRVWQVVKGGAGVLRFIWISNGITDDARSSISAGIGDFDDLDWHHIACTVNGNDINIYVDGVEASAYSQQDLVAGGGFTGAPSTVDTLSISASEGGTAFAEQTLSRLKFWEGTTLSTCQVLIEFNAEVALIGSPLTVTGGTVERLNLWDASDPGLARVNTVTEPFAFGDVLARAEISGQTLTGGQIIRLNEWGGLDPALSIAGNSVIPFNLGDVLNDAMGIPPISTQLTAKQVDDLNDWELSDPGLENVQTPEEPFNLGDTLNTLLSR